MAAGDDVVWAAGGVVWRASGAHVVIALVHRPRYDDWSLPKGKRRAGEHLVATARREVAEETGELTTVGRPLGSSRYPVRVKGRRTTKEVVWWAMEGNGRQPVEGHEVDEVRWLAPEEAARQLTHRHEVEVVHRFMTGPPRTSIVLLVRNARPGARRLWTDDDALRPLDAAGQAQAQALTDVLVAFGPSRVVTAPPVRCVQTVLPLAERLDLPVRIQPLLGDHGHQRSAVTGTDVVRRQAVAPVSVLCSSGRFIPDVVTAFRAGHVSPGPPAADKGGVWVLALHADRLLSAAHLSSPRPRGSAHGG